jgi:hypothetical protein
MSDFNKEGFLAFVLLSEIFGLGEITDISAFGTITREHNVEQFPIFLFLLK